MFTVGVFFTVASAVFSAVLLPSLMCGDIWAATVFPLSSSAYCTFWIIFMMFSWGTAFSLWAAGWLFVISRMGFWLFFDIFRSLSFFN